MSTNKTFNKVQLDVKFTQATSRVNLISEENISISFGKISKYFADLHSQAFTGYTHPTYTARTGKPTGNQTPGFGSTFTISQITSDGTGHVTAATDRTVKIPDTTMGAASADAAGSKGLVPAPAAGKQTSFLRGDGTWVVPTNTTYSAGAHLSLSSTTFSLASYCKSITDWNNATTNGWYMGSSVTNAPSTEWWMGRVIAHNNKYCIQEVWNFSVSAPDNTNPDAMYMSHKKRWFRAEHWGPWVDVSTPTPSAKVDCDWNTVASRTTNVTRGWMAFWNGAYDGTSSNLTYCNRGAFGTIVTKNTGDYVPNTQAGVNAAINLLSTGSSTPSLADYYLSQYANGGTTTTSYHRRPISALWDAFKGLITLETTGTGNAVTAVSIANDGNSNRKITVTKGSTFSLSTHTHSNYLPMSTVSSSTDADTLFTTSQWINWNTTTEVETTHMPTTNYGILLAKAYPGIQVFIPDSAAGIYFRKKTNANTAATAWWGITGTAGNTYNLNNFLPLSGGTMTGDIVYPHSDGRSSTMTNSGMTYKIAQLNNWAMGLIYVNSGGTHVGFIGAYGTTDAFESIRFGAKYDNYWMKITGTETTITGDLGFSTVTSTTYPAESKKIKFGGSTDWGRIYYRVDASDAGRLVLDIGDDSNARIDFAYNGTTKSYIDTSGNFSGNAANVTGTVAIANGGTGATTRLNALKNLTNENVGSSANYFLTITSSWGKGGYTSVADAKTVLGLKSAAYTESSAYLSSTTKYAGSSSAGGPALSVSTAGGDVVLGTNGSSSDDSGDIVWNYGNGKEKARLWQDNTYTAKAGPQYRIYKSDGTGLYSGRLPLADGTSASGTWGISITGSAASAAKLETARNINGVSFDGSANITIPRSIKHIHTASGTEGSAGWVKIARITVTAAYANHPMTFTIAQRRIMQYRIHLVFVNNGSVAAAAISEFIIARDNSWTDTNNNPRAYIIKPSNGIFDLYIRKTEAYDHIFVVDFTKADGSEGDNYSVTWTNVHVADSAITGGTEATKKTYSTTDHTHSYIPMSGSTSVTGNIEITKASGEVGFYAKRSDTGVEVWMGVGSGGTNHGIYSNKLGKWMMYGDATNVYLNGNAVNVTGTVAIANGGTGATTRLAALRALTEQGVGTNAQYFLTITQNWGQGGYTSVADAKTVLGLKSAAYTESSAYLSSTTKYAGSSSVGGPANSATRADYVNVVASNEIRFYNDNQLKANNHLWIGYSWATGSHYTPSGGSDTSSMTAPNITEFVMGNCSAGGLASVHAKTFILGNGSSPTKSSKTTTITTAATITDRTITLPDASGTVALLTKGSTNYWGMIDGDGATSGWIRTTTNGLIAATAVSLANGGDGALGTSSWAFKEAYIAKVHALKHYGWYGQKTNDTRQSTANLTCGGNGAMQLILVSSTLTTGRPAADGYIMDFDWDNTGQYKAQLFMPNSVAYNSSLQWRGQTGSSDWSAAACAWRNVLDANNLEYMATHSTEFKRSFDLDVPMSPILRSTSFYNRANRFALIEAGKIVIQYSSNNGSTWTDMAWDTTDNTTYNKSILFNDTINASVPIGPRDSSDRTTSMKTRIIVTVDDRDVMVDQFLLQLNSAYQKITVTLEASKVGSVDTFETLSSLTIDQWDYQCCINTKGIRFNTSSGNYAKLRITLGYSTIDSKHKTSVSTVLGIAAYSGIYWGTNLLVNGGIGKSDIALYDRPYAWMNDGTMLIPTQLKIFNGNYGTFIRSDGANTYFLLTNSGPAQTGLWNSLRPLYFSNSTGFVTMENGASISSSAYGALSIKRTSANNAGIKFYNNGSTYLGSLAIDTVNGTFHRFKTDESTMYEIIDRSVVRNNTTVGTLGWTSSSADTVIPTVNTIAFWNGAYSGTSSNLTYCKQGAFGTIVTKSTTDYSKVSISRNLTSGTKVGTIKIDGTATDLYCQTNSDTKVTQNIASGSANLPLLMSYYQTGTAVTAAQVVYRNNSIYANPSAGTITANKFYGDITGDGLNAGIYDLLNTDDPTFNGTEWMLTSIPSSSGGTSTPSFRRVKTAKFADYVSSTSRTVLFDQSDNTSTSISLSTPPTDTQYLKLYFKSSGNNGQPSVDNSVYSIAEVPYMTGVNLGGILQVAQSSDNQGALRLTALAFNVKITTGNPYTLRLIKVSKASRISGSGVSDDSSLSANIIKVVAYR